MNDDNPVLQARGLTRSFGSGEVKTTALDGVSLDLFRGQMSLLMGPSGSGKSTLLAILSGLLKPDQGEVVALGQDLWQLTDQERAWISPDGSVRWFNFTHVPLRDHGTISGLVCTVQEVTTRRELDTNTTCASIRRTPGSIIRLEKSASIAATSSAPTTGSHRRWRLIHESRRLATPSAPWPSAEETLPRPSGTSVRRSKRSRTSDWRTSISP